MIGHVDSIKKSHYFLVKADFFYDSLQNREICFLVAENNFIVFYFVEHNILKTDNNDPQISRPNSFTAKKLQLKELALGEKLINSMLFAIALKFGL